MLTINDKLKINAGGNLISQGLIDNNQISHLIMVSDFFEKSIFLKESENAWYTSWVWRS